MYTCIHCHKIYNKLEAMKKTIVEDVDVNVKRCTILSVIILLIKKYPKYINFLMYFDIGNTANYTDIL